MTGQSREARPPGQPRPDTSGRRWVRAPRPPRRALRATGPGEASASPCRCPGRTSTRAAPGAAFSRRAARQARHGCSAALDAVFPSAGLLSQVPRTVQPSPSAGVSSSTVRSGRHAAMASLTRVSAGLPFPLGATWDGSGRQRRGLLRPRQPHRALPVRRRRPARDRAHRAARVHPRGLARLLPRPASGPALRAAGARSLRAAEAATASTRTSCCSTPTPAPTPASCAGTTRSTATGSAARRPTSPSTAATAPGRCRSAGSSTPPTPGAPTSRRGAAGRRR